MNIIRGLALLCVTAFWSFSANAGETLLVTVEFEHQALDLETGIISESIGSIPSADADVQLAYNSLRATKAVVFPAAAGVELALVEGLAFDGVTADCLVGLEFSPHPPDVPFSTGVTVIVRTVTGAVFKLGNASESDTGVTFNYAAL